MTNGPQSNKGLGHGIDRDGGHDTRIHIAAGFEDTAQHQAVGHGCDHPDVVGFRPLDAPLLTQLAAVNKALSRAGYAIVATGLQQCLTKNDGDLDGVDVKKMEKLFLSLA